MQNSKPDYSAPGVIHRSPLVEYWVAPVYLSCQNTKDFTKYVFGLTWRLNFKLMLRIKYMLLFQNLAQLYHKQQNPNCEECRRYALFGVGLCSGAHFEKNGDSLKKERESPQLQTAATKPTSLPVVSQQCHLQRGISGSREVARIPWARSRNLSTILAPILSLSSSIWLRWLSNKSRDNNMTRATNDVQGKEARGGYGVGGR